jgi:hypothetical protein
MLRSFLVFLALAAVALGALTLMGAPAGAAGPARPAAVQWGPDIRVNPVTTATPSVQQNYAVAIDPGAANHVFAAYDSRDLPATLSGYAFSADAGRTWNGARFYGPWISDTVPSGQTGVGFDGQHIVYYGTRIATTDLSVNGYAVLTTTDGLTWSAPHITALSATTMESRDQLSMAVDSRAAGSYAGSVYVAYHLALQGIDSGVQIRYSRDGARTWSGDTLVSDAGHEGGEFPQPVLAPDGSVYLSYMLEDENFFLDHSTDGGQTWGADQPISGGPITPIGAEDPEGRELMLLGNANDAGLAIINRPFIAVAPGDPRTVYAVWADGRWDSSFLFYGNPGQHADVAFSRTTDGGATWTAPVRLNDDAVGNGKDQFLPSIAVGPDGRIGVTWNDRRDDPDGYLYKLYYTESTDGGLTWAANAPVADMASDPTSVIGIKGNSELGDHQALAFGPDYALPLWADSRAGYAEDVFTDRGALIGLPTATMPAATATSTATPTVVASPTPCAIRFSDVLPSDYFYTPVQYLACHGAVSGYADGTFRPYNNSTRGQLSKMIAAGFGWSIQNPASPTFADVPPSHPFYSVVETAYAHGIISGYTCGGPGEPCDAAHRPYFRPGADVTRGQLSKMIVIARGWAPLTPATPAFRDVPASHPFYSYIERMAAQGVISGYACGGPGEPCASPGDLYFRAFNNATRGQLSKMLYGAITAP